jgi:hypothetical protein
MIGLDDDLQPDWQAERIELVRDAPDLFSGVDLR